MQLEPEGGSFLLGGIDHSQYTGEFIYTPPVTDPVFWQISLQGLGIRSDGNVMVMSQNIFQDAALILDSGTSSILIPTAASEVIHPQLSGTWDPIHRAWFLPCEGPDLIWWISSGHGVVQPYKSLVHLLEDGRCQSLIFENQDANYWILGDTQLRGLYLVYDMEGNGRIGIAKAVSSTSMVRGGTSLQDVGILTVQDENAGRRLLMFNHGVGCWGYLVAHGCGFGVDGSS
ncbi:aspartic peptidase domain-containing protein [Dissophora ornata]|nr:aspartic peptidase domain-containing protein [Dissophora ornata]